MADPILKKTYTWYLNKPGNAVNDCPELKDYSEDQTFSDYLSPSTVPLQTDGFSYEWSREEHESTHKDFTLLFRARPTCERVPEVITEENRIRLDYWQYIKEFVFFGGSHKEGAVVAPDPAWIDEAHNNGVGIFGTVFLSPLHFGGDRNNIAELAKSEILQKLVDIAHRLNFEGWFLNVESFEDYTEPFLQDLKLSLENMDPKGKQMIWYLPRCAKNFDPKREGVTMTCDDKISNIAKAFKEESERKLYLDFKVLTDLLKTSEKYIMFADEPYWNIRLKDKEYLVELDRFLDAQNCLQQLFLGQYGLQSKPAVWYGIAKYAMERKRISKD
nr:uncharacterized protein LOC100535819 [Danio rerio]|eukprot:XP_003198960.1 uncharacterized protein LOC100535819 [Danio rerio]